MFIVAVVQHIKIEDLSQGGVPLYGDESGYSVSSANENDHLPEGTELGDNPRLSRSGEYSLVRESTSGFTGENNSVYEHTG
jgi:proteasome activator subunit 4